MQYQQRKNFRLVLTSLRTVDKAADNKIASQPVWMIIQLRICISIVLSCFCNLFTSASKDLICHYHFDVRPPLLTVSLIVAHFKSWEGHCLSVSLHKRQLLFVLVGKCCSSSRMFSNSQYLNILTFIYLNFIYIQSLPPVWLLCDYINMIT